MPGAANHYNFEPQLRDNNSMSRLEKMTPPLHAEGENIVDNPTLPDDFYSSDYFTEKPLQFLKERGDLLIILSQHYIGHYKLLRRISSPTMEFIMMVQKFYDNADWQS